MALAPLGPHWRGPKMQKRAKKYFSVLPYTHGMKKLYAWFMMSMKPSTKIVKAMTPGS